MGVANKKKTTIKITKLITLYNIQRSYVTFCRRLMYVLIAFGKGLKPKVISLSAPIQ